MKWPRYRLLRAIYPAFRLLFPNQMIQADDLGRAMVDVALQKTAERESQIFENRDIRAMVESFQPSGGDSNTSATSKERSGVE